MLYRRHVGAARAAARTLVRSRSTAEDLVAEGFTRILAAMRRGAGPEVAFRPYLLTCVKNAAYDRYRRDRKVDLTADVEAAQADPALLDPALLTEERHMIARAFASLPDRWQAVLWHTEIEGLSASAVATMLGLSPNAVSALNYRAREGLRQAFLQAHIGAATPATCRASRTRLGRYVRHALSPTEQAAVERHVETCDNCRALLAELTDVDTSLRSVMVPLVVGGPAGAYLAGLSAGGLGAAGLGVGGLGVGLVAMPALKIGLIAASVFAVAGGVVLASDPDGRDPPTATSVTVVIAGSAGEERGPGGAGAESSSAAPGSAGDPVAPGAAPPGAPADPGAAATTVPGGALPLTASPSQTTASGGPPTVTASPPPTDPSLIPPSVTPLLPTLPITLPTLPPITLPTLPPITLPTLPPITLPTLPPITLPTLPPLPTSILPTLPPLPTLPITLPTLPPLPTLPTLP